MSEGIRRCNHMPVKDKMDRQHWALSLFNKGSGTGTARAWNLIQEA